jgi:hypothetical protein
MFGTSELTKVLGFRQNYLRDFHLRTVHFLTTIYQLLLNRHLAETELYSGRYKINSTASSTTLAVLFYLGCERLCGFKLTMFVLWRTRSSLNIYLCVVVFYCCASKTRNLS